MCWLRRADVSTSEFQVNETQKEIVEDVLQNMFCYLNDDVSATEFELVSGADGPCCRKREGCGRE